MIYQIISSRDKTVILFRPDLTQVLGVIFLILMARSLAPYIHVILADVVSITLYINKPLVRLTTAHYQSTVRMISFAQVLTAQ